MQTELLRYVSGPAGEAALERAAALLRAGRLVAFPTETVYGVGALALDEAAARRIFEAKQRPTGNPLIVHVAVTGEARALVDTWPEKAAVLAARFWPGPLTLVLPKAAQVPELVTAGLRNVALRLPAHPVARELLARVGQPIAAPSANRYTTVSPTTASHVIKSLGGRIDAVLDGGATPLGIESTVLDLSGPEAILLRPGAVTAAEIEAVIGPIQRWEGSEAPRDASMPSPGLSRRHYAPAGEVRWVEAGELAVALAAIPAGERVGVLSRAPRPPGVEAIWVQLPAEPAGYARQLYGALHALEDAGARHVFLESPPDDPAWEGIRDRLRRAAG